MSHQYEIDEDTAEYFDDEIKRMYFKHRAIEQRSHEDGSIARKQWMRAASEALRNGAVFYAVATRSVAKPWDGRMANVLSGAIRTLQCA